MRPMTQAVRVVAVGITALAVTGVWVLCGSDVISGRLTSYSAVCLQKGPDGRCQTIGRTMDPAVFEISVARQQVEAFAESGGRMQVPLVRRHIQKGLALPLVYRRLIRTRLSRWSALVENQGFRRDRLGFPATVAGPVVEERRTSREPGSQAISVQEIAGRSMHAALSKEPRTPVSRACRRSRASRRWQGA